MIEINIGALVVLLGIPTAVTGFCFWMLEHRIQKREKQKEAEEAKRQKEAAARERAREDLQIITIQGTSAAIALGEATARAVQRIPDAHCNGDMHAALDYAAKIKHAQKDFLTSQGSTRSSTEEVSSMAAKKRRRKRKKKIEASKKLAYWAASVATLSAASSLLLSAFGRDPVGELTGTIFTACVGYLITYAGKSLGEKISRNRHGLDADGNPLPDPSGDTLNNEEAKG